MILTRQEKEKQILDLYNQGKTYKQIAEIVRVSPRDIKPVLRRAEKEREKELGINIQEGNNGSTENQNQTQKKTSIPSKAYRLFSEGKTPLDVAIELNLKEPEATKYYRQYWKLRQLHNLNLIYEDIGDDIIHIVKLHRKMRAASIGVEQAINLIKTANNDLPAVEQKYQKLKRDVNSLESRKLEGYRTLNDLQDQIDGSERTLKWLQTSCEEEEAKINQLESKKIRLKRLVKRFKDNNEEYLKIKKTVIQQVTSILFDVKGLLRLSLSSLMESMRTDPQKYSTLIYYNRSSAARDIDQRNTGYYYVHGQKQPYPSYDYFLEVYKSTLLDDTEKLYTKSVEELTEQIITEFSIKNSSSQLFKPDREQQQFYHKPSNRPSLLTALRNNQAYPFKRVEHIFVKTEL
jgi:transposase